MMEKCAAMIELLSMFKDSERHPIVVESKDWELIPQALADFALVVLPVIGPGKMSLGDAMVILRTATEAVYTMGYNRGKRESVIGLDWAVAEEQD